MIKKLNKLQDIRIKILFGLFIILIAVILIEQNNKTTHNTEENHITSLNQNENQ